MRWSILQNLLFLKNKKYFMAVYLSGWRRSGDSYRYSNLSGSNFNATFNKYFESRALTIFSKAIVCFTDFTNFVFSSFGVTRCRRSIFLFAFSAFRFLDEILSWELRLRSERTIKWSNEIEVHHLWKEKFPSRSFIGKWSSLIKMSLHIKKYLGIIIFWYI